MKRGTPARGAATPPTARDVAARVVARVVEEQSFAAAALEGELGRAVQLEARDRALATELVYGTLRVMPWLLGEIGRHVPKGIASVDERVRAPMVVAAYQLWFTRVPAFAAVSEAVEAVRHVRGPKVAAFANAVLRRVSERAAREREQAKDPEAMRERAVVESTPAGLRAALARAMPEEEVRAFLAMGTEPPPVALRVERAEERDAWIEKLRAAAPGATFEPGRVSPLAILARGAGRPQSLPGWSEGAWTVQEEGSQVAALALGAREGERVLDACAGRGNKTGVLARAVGATGAVDACDTSPTKLTRLQEDLARLGLHVRATHAVDWTVGSGEVTGTYDRVLVDAPCTGVGTLRRRPEITLRLKEQDLVDKPRAQLAIASRAADHVRPGGSLVYVVCSVLREEAEDVIDALLRARTDLRRAEGGDSRLLPHVQGTDGYFVARLAKT
ncbi:MAG TPA: transcription antitermination factor NusB [Polyangiaceae bacterium]|nr:transcription antitermination factor NusB [Polyangiaceae bacterium]